MKKLGKEIADGRVNMLSQLYEPDLAYYEDIDISKYYFKVRWYSLEDLIRLRSL